MVQSQVWLPEGTETVGNEEIEECLAQRPGTNTNVFLEVSKKESTEEAGAGDELIEESATDFGGAPPARVVEESFEWMRDFQKGQSFGEPWFSIVFKMSGAKFKKTVFFCPRKGTNRIEWNGISNCNS